MTFFSDLSDFADCVRSDLQACAYGKAGQTNSLSKKVFGKGAWLEREGHMRLDFADALHS